MGLSLKSGKAEIRVSAGVAGTVHAAGTRPAPIPGPHLTREPCPWTARGCRNCAGGVHSQSRLLEFLNLFLVLLPSRVNNVIGALDSGDREAASAAAQSLASSAAMAGAPRLELVAWLVDADLRIGRMDRARETGRRLGPDASELAAALSRLLTGN